MTLLADPQTVPLGAPDVDAPPMPEPVGPLSRFTMAIMRSPRRTAGVTEIVGLDLDDPLGDLDFQLSLRCLHELHGRSFAGVHPDAEWHPSVVDWWHRTASRFEAALRSEVPVRPHVGTDAGDAIDELARGSGDRSLARYVSDHSGRAAEGIDVLGELRIHRPASRLDELDPYAVATLRLGGVESLGLAPSDGQHLRQVPATTLATSNVRSHLALHRRLLPAFLGHLAVLETMSVPATTEHHGQCTRSELVRAYVSRNPGSAPMAVWGAEITMALEHRFADHLIESWEAGRSSLRDS